MGLHDVSMAFQGIIKRFRGAQECFSYPQEGFQSVTKEFHVESGDLKGVSWGL